MFLPSGLLGQLRHVIERRHIKEYKGLRVAVDVHCWLHRGTFSCIDELISGVNTDKYVVFCMDMINYLISHGIKPYIIFDGRSLPAKKDRNLERRKQRENNRALALEAMKNGDNQLAYTYFKRSVAVTSKMSYKLIKALREKNIEYLVSPYESDAQLAYLSINRLVDAVITEDSDAIVYGCSRTLFKLDKETGYGDEILRKNLGTSQTNALSFSCWSDDQFKLFCCLSGCDYVRKLSYMGIKTAYQMMKDCKSFQDIKTKLKNSRFVNDADDTFFHDLEQALFTFKHQLIFDPISKTLKNLLPISDNYLAKCSADDFLGEFITQELLLELVAGSLDPNSMRPYEEKEDSSSVEQLSKSDECNPIWKNRASPDRSNDPKDSCQIKFSHDNDDTQYNSPYIFPNQSDREVESNNRPNEGTKRKLPWNNDGLNYFKEFPLYPKINLISQESTHNKSFETDMFNDNNQCTPSNTSNTFNQNDYVPRSNNDFIQNIISPEHYIAYEKLPDSLRRKKKYHTYQFNTSNETNTDMVFGITESEISIHHQNHENIDFKKAPFFTKKINVSHKSDLDSEYKSNSQNMNDNYDVNNSNDLHCKLSNYSNYDENTPPLDDLYSPKHNQFTTSHEESILSTSRKGILPSQHFDEISQLLSKKSTF